MRVRGRLPHRDPPGAVALSLAALLLLTLSLLPGAQPLPFPRAGDLAPPSGRIAVAAPVALGGPSILDGYTLGSPLAPDTPLTTAITVSGPAHADALRSYLRAEGLSVEARPGMIVWLVSGPVADLDRAFATGVAGYHGPEGRSTLAFTTPPTVPTGLPVLAVAPPESLLGVTDAIATHGKAAPATVDGTSCPAPYAGVLDPAQVQSAYNITPVLARGIQGEGETIGIVDAFDSAEPPPTVAGDLQQFSLCNHLPPANLAIAYPVPSQNENASPSSGWGLEIALDTQWAHATAPMANLLLALSPNSAYGLYFSVDWLVAGHQANVISLSWGEPETGIYNLGPCSYQCNASSDGSLATLGPVFAQAASEGIDVFVASGDCGANGGTPAFSPWYPASDPHAIGVGGTVLKLNSTGGYGGEWAWNGTETLCGNGGGSGGGFSTLPRPSWQGGPGFGRFANVTRGVPDVALTAGVPLGMIYNGSPVFVEGTSDAAPQWAGMGALLGEAMGTGSPGFLAPSLYHLLDSSAYARDFHDITGGDNGFLAGPGWDPLTGIGTPDFGELVQSLTTSPPVRLGGPGELTLSASPLAGVAPVPWEPLPVNLSVQPWAGGATPVRYQYYLGDVGTPYQESNSTTTDQPWVTAAYRGPGAYVAFATGYGAGGNTSISNPLVINVGNSGPLGATLSASPQAPAAGQVVTFTAQASGGQGPYRYAYFFGDGTYESSWGSDGPLLTHAYPANGTYLVTVVANDSSLPLRGGWATTCVVVGNSSLPCPTVPRTLVVSLVPENSTMEAGSSGNAVRVSVTYGGAPVPGAQVTMGSGHGGFAVSSGLTDAQGVFNTTFDTPPLGQTQIFPLYANVTAGGFQAGVGEALVVVDPISGPSLVPSITPDQPTVLSQASDGVVILANVAVSGRVVDGAHLQLSSSVGRLSPSTGEVNAEGYFVGVLVAPNTSVMLQGTLTVSASFPGYTSSSTSVGFTVLPGPGAVVLELSLNHTTLPSMASSGVDLTLLAPQGGIHTEPVGGFAETATGGWYSKLTHPAAGQYTVAYSAPVTRTNLTTLLSFNVTALTGAQILGSNVALVNVTWGHGGMTVGLSTPDPAPNVVRNLTVTVSSTATGFPLASTLVVVNIGPHDRGNASPNVGWTDAWGHLTLPYKENISLGTIDFSFLVIGFAYRLTQVTINVSQPTNDPTIPSDTPWVVGGAALGTSLLLAVVWTARRGQKTKDLPLS